MITGYALSAMILTGFAVLLWQPRRRRLHAQKIARVRRAIADAQLRQERIRRLESWHDDWERQEFLRTHAVEIRREIDEQQERQPTVRPADLRILCEQAVLDRHGFVPRHG